MGPRLPLGGGEGVSKPVAFPSLEPWEKVGWVGEGGSCQWKEAGETLMIMKNAQDTKTKRKLQADAADNSATEFDSLRALGS